jgi:tripartite-type tricarboxylate transporter receptor subunit TctC
MLATLHTHVNKPANPVTDLEHITMLGSGAFTFTVNAGVPAATYPEFIALAKREPNKMKHGTPGAGGNIHLVAELFKIRAGIEMVAVHYSAAGSILTDVLQNEIQMAINAIQLTAPHIRAGKLRGLFVAATEREPDVPDMPTSAELGLKDLDLLRNWFGLHAPKGTAPDVLAQIHAATIKALNVPEARKKLVDGGFRPGGESPREFEATIRTDDRIFAEVAKTSGVRIE